MCLIFYLSPTTPFECSITIFFKNLLSFQKLSISLKAILFLKEKQFILNQSLFLNMQTSLPEEVLTPQNENSIPQTEVDNNVQNDRLPEETENQTADETKSEPVTKQSVIAALTEIAQTDCADITAETIARLKQNFYNIHNEQIRQQKAQFIADGGAEADFVPQTDPEEETVKQLIAAIKEKKATQRALIEATQLRNYERKREIIAELNSLSGDTDTVNLHYPKVKELQAEFKELGDVSPQHTTEIWKAYQDAVEKFYDQWKVNKELRDYDFKKNLIEKQLLLDEAVRLNDNEDIIFAFRRLQELHDKWREIGPVAKDVREELWNSFKNASADINKRYQTFFEERKAKEKENEQAKNQIILQLKELDFDAPKTYAEWDAMTAQILQAQEEWKKLGYASRKVNNTLFAEYRAICDDFFARKTAFFKRMKTELAENLEKKTQLCLKAEELSQSEDWKKTTDLIVRLQKEWKTIGPVARKHSDAVWRRFIDACDTFFDRKKKALSGTRKIEQENLAAKREIIARLTEIRDAETPQETAPIVEEIHALRNRWQQTGHVPYKEKDRIQEKYRNIVSELFDKYDLKGHAARIEAFEAEINQAGADPVKLRKERDRLARTYDQKLNELKTYENNLGFLNATSKNGSSILRDMENKIQRLKDDIQQLTKKITIIDDKL